MSKQKENMMEHTEQLRNIEMWMKQGAITYDRAKEMAKPHIDALNEKAREIAKKYGTKPRTITFAAFMR
jgi:DNA anti-recombination protein RmuC